MPENVVHTIARVECRSEGRNDDIPIAVVIGNRRLEIVEILDRAVITSVEPGEPVHRRWWVELEDGRRCELMRAEPDGRWRVRVEH